MQTIQHFTQDDLIRHHHHIVGTFALDWCENGLEWWRGQEFQTPVPVPDVRAVKPELKITQPLLFLLENYYLLMVTRPYLEQLDRLIVYLHGLTRREILWRISGLSLKGRTIYTHDDQLRNLPTRNAVI